MVSRADLQANMPDLILMQMPLNQLMKLVTRYGI